MSEPQQGVENSLVNEFWLRVRALTEYQAQYGYYLSLLNAKKDPEAEEKGLLMDDEDNANLKTLLYNLHFNVNLTFISYSTIAESHKLGVILSKTEEKKYVSLKKLKDNLQAKYIMDLQSLEDYLIILHRYIAKHIAKDILKSTTDKAMDSYTSALNHNGAENGGAKDGNEESI